MLKINPMCTRAIRLFGMLMFIFTAVLNSFSQKSSNTSFYRHYKGTFDTSMQITADLFSNNGIVKGYYYYFFPEPGTDTVYHYGKTIEIDGSIMDNSIVLHEFSNTESSFTGIIKKDHSISGTWVRNAKEKPIPFEMSEDYGKNSLPFKSYVLTNQRYLIKKDHKKEGSPKATINLSLLFPDLKSSDRLNDSLDLLITQVVADTPMIVSDRELFMQNVIFDFFDRYHQATSGIEDIAASAASFNWEKNISMEIIYNENNILSLKFEKYGYTGGAHGIKIMQYAVFNTALKKRIRLDDIFTEGYKPQLDKILETKLRKLNGLKQDEKLKEAGFFMDQIESSDNFFINNDGIGVFFNVYEIAPYSTGTTTLFVSFDELKNLLKPNHPFTWIKKNQN